MAWEDVILGLGGIFFAIALVPSLINKEKPHIATSLITSFVLSAYTMAYVSLELYIAAGVAAVTSFMWALLAYQRHYGH